MARLRYLAICSLDGYTADADGDFGFAAPDAELHQLVNDLSREVGTHLSGRRDHEVMRFWETAPGDVPGPEGEFARIWRATDKVVFSTTLEEVTTARTRLVDHFDPAAVEAIVAESTLDVAIGGPTLAAEAFRAGLVDEVHLFLHPVVVGGGLRALPDDVRLDLELLSAETVGDVVHLHHRVRR